MSTRISKIRNQVRQIASLLLIALVTTLIVACAEATEPQSADLATDPPQNPTATTEATPKPAVIANDLVSNNTEPTLVPAATLAPVEAQPKPVTNTANIDPTSTPSTAQPEVIPSATSAPVPTATTSPPQPGALPSATAAPAAAPPTATTAPQPTATPTAVPTIAPTPRPTPGPISRQTQFVPLDEPKYVTRNQASANITNASYVLGVASNGEARAYPLDMMWYHHIANDTVGGEPWLITY